MADAGVAATAAPGTLVLTSLEALAQVRERFEDDASAAARRAAADARARTARAALREARRVHRRAPVAALDLLEPLALEGLPDDLARHLYGLWLTVCRRLGLLAAIHVRAGRGRGAVLMPAPDGDWEVVSAIGLRRWPRGRRLPPRSLSGARPLG